MFWKAIAHATLTSPMPGTRFIAHHGVPILFLDYAGVKHRDEALALIRQTRELVADLPRDGTLRTLTHVAGANFDADVLAAVRELAEHNAPWVRVGAVVGLSGLMRAVFSAIMHLTGRDLRAFEDLETAKDFLAGVPRSLP
ncbi:MAG TPA: hypothetical protein VFK36_07495 [Gemmatimonadales bacterium]|jgi:hypothetical protein|nr:hypothetical protein [Gemmatimonadales bacterium]HET9151838.1 hypothetical protein [Gemmatimonadales bacterium]